MGFCNRVNNAAQGAANSNPVGAPSHLAMVANLANDAGQNVGFHQDTNLADMQTDDWAKLKDHMSEINQYPQCVCFNCGITMYPTDVKKIVAMGITKKEQCQGYLVFKDYIEELATKRGVSEGEVFLCQREGAGCRVFSCHTCSRDGTSNTTKSTKNIQNPEMLPGNICIGF